MIKNPVSDHLPTGCPKYAMSYSAEEIVDVRDYVPKDGPAVFVIGAMAHGSVSLRRHFVLSSERISYGWWCVIFVS